MLKRRVENEGRVLEVASTMPVFVALLLTDNCIISPVGKVVIVFHCYGNLTTKFCKRQSARSHVCVLCDCSADNSNTADILYPFQTIETHTFLSVSLKLEIKIKIILILDIYMSL